METVIQDSIDAITFQDLESNILAWNRGAGPLRFACTREQRSTGDNIIKLIAR